MLFSPDTKKRVLLRFGFFSKMANDEVIVHRHQHGHAS